MLNSLKTSLSQPINSDKNRFFDAVGLGLLGLNVLVLGISSFSANTAIMSDEQTYNGQARYPSVVPVLYGNYLHSWIFSSTQLCDQSFYACAKFGNLAFHLIWVVAVFGLANLLLGRSHALLFAGAMAWAPSGMYVSVFMPETMYFALVTAATYSFVRLIRKPTDSANLWLVPLTFSLAPLTKPHAYLAVGILSILVVLQMLKGGRLQSNRLRVMLLLTSSAASHFVFAVLLSGGNYRIPYSGSSSTSGGSTTSVATLASGISPDGFLFIFNYSSLMFVSLSILGGGFYLLVVLEAVRRRALESFDWAVLLLTISYLAFIAVFSYYLTFVAGNDHSTRPLLRYFEFLPVLWFLSALSLVMRGFRPRMFTISLAITVSATSALSLLQSGLFNPDAFGFADSSFLEFFDKLPQLLLLVIALQVFSTIFVLSRRSILLPMAGMIGTFMLAGVVTIGGFQEKYSQPVVGVDAAMALSTILRSEANYSGVAIAGDWQSANVVKFYGGVPDATYVPLDSLDSLQQDESFNLEGIRYLVLLGDRFFSGRGSIIARGLDFQIWRLSESSAFSAPAQSEPRVELRSEAVSTAWGAWSTENPTILVVYPDKDRDRTLSLELIASDLLENKTVSISHLGSSVEGTLPDEQQAQSLFLDIPSGSEPIQISITLIDTSLTENNNQGISSKLLIGFRKWMFD